MFCLSLNAIGWTTVLSASFRWGKSGSAICHAYLPALEALDLCLALICIYFLAKGLICPVSGDFW
jgi:hypothetical protein